MRRRQTKPEVIDMSVRSWERGRQRERNYYDEEDIVFRRRPEFLRNDYYRGDRAPLVRHAREVDRSSRPTNSALAPGISRRQSSLDTFDRRPRSTSPEIRIRQRSVEGSPSPSERMRTRYAERERPGREVDIAFRRGRTSSETRDGRRSPPPASRPSVYYDTSRLAAVEYKTTRYREVDEVIWDLSRTKDVTLHLELDITQDLELDLDEFCYLSRLGHFHQAKQFFRDNLEQHMGDPYVFVQYAQMLLEMGDYKSVKALNVPYSLEEPENFILHTNWKLIQSISTLQTEGLREQNDIFSAQAAATAAASATPRALKSLKREPPKDKDQKAAPMWTEIHKRLITKKALIELGYEYEETEYFFYVTETLDVKEIEELVKLSEEHKAIESGLKKPSVFGSTECQILSLSLCFLTHFPRTEIGKFNWGAIYETMLRQGRIWDLRDIFTAAVRYYGQERACDEFLGSDENPPNKIILDWLAATYDESTNLALLDILVSIVLARPLSPGTAFGIKHFVDQAGHLASSIVQHQPSNLKSRQYIRWILAKVAVTSYRDVLSSGPVSKLPGLFLTKRAALDPYIYIPVASETPDWSLLCLPSRSYETQQMVLKAARELSDLQTEVECLKQLIAHCSDPTEYYDELIHLQETVQCDIDGWLHTCLSKYIICRDKQSRDALREQILSVTNYTKLDAELVFARCMILRALSHSGKEANLFLAEARECSQGLSSTIHAFLESNEPAAEEALQVETPLPNKMSTLRGTRSEGLTKGNPKAVTFSGVSPKETGKEKIEIATRDEDDEAGYYAKRANRRIYFGEAYNGATKDRIASDVPLESARRHRFIPESASSESDDQLEAPNLGPSTGIDNRREVSVQEPNPGIGNIRDGRAARYGDDKLELEDQLEEEFSSGSMRSKKHRKEKKDSKLKPLNPNRNVSPDFDQHEETITATHGKPPVQREDYSPSRQASGGSYYPDTDKFPPPPSPRSPSWRSNYPETKEFPQPATEDLAHRSSNMQIMRYNPRAYLWPRPSNDFSKQTLSDIYVTINEAGTEGKAARLRLDKEKKQNGVYEPVSRNPDDDITGTATTNAIEEPTDDWSGWVLPTKKSKKDKKKRNSGASTLAEPAEDALKDGPEPEFSQSQS